MWYLVISVGRSRKKCVVETDSPRYGVRELSRALLLTLIHHLLYTRSIAAASERCQAVVKQEWGKSWLGLQETLGASWVMERTVVIFKVTLNS